MGSLNVEILKEKDDETCLANGYYHFAGSSYESLRTIMPLLIYLKEHPIKNMGTLEAVELLQLTGAEIIYNDLDIAEDLGVILKKIGTPSDRDGIISISSSEIEETETSAESMISIYAQDNSFSFGVMNEASLLGSEGLLLSIPFHDLLDLRIERAEEFYKYIAYAHKKNMSIRTLKDIYNLIY